MNDIYQQQNTFEINKIMKNKKKYKRSKIGRTPGDFLHNSVFCTVGMLAYCTKIRFGTKLQSFQKVSLTVKLAKFLER
jgi:hypothetical protein